ncbi:MAG: poly-gamma-glutamate hydrolase family protein [Kineosporiaceae bacterium]|nr:poly-gamma-glutamate hydrolase family protein [Kineosporiaceae bacterium]MBK7622545.1 poly-gamma-glutamate hydrolase family protein [Kineosporiaceae bacterium]
MATFEAQVRRAIIADQPDLLDHAEHCSADAESLAAIGRGLGHQLRVHPVGRPSHVALYTVSQLRDETPATVVRMGSGGRHRLVSPPPEDTTIDVVVDSVVPRRGLDDADAARLGEFVERLDDDGCHRGLIAIAPHGGDIEPHTDTQAERLAEALAHFGVSAWRCKGFGLLDRGAGERFHITSTDLHEASFPGLQAVIDRGFRYAVAFHGFRGAGVLVGGGAPFRLKAEVASALEQALAGAGLPVRIAGPDDVLGGDSPRNIVNRLTLSGRGGIHLEQSLIARTEHATTIADAVAQVFAGRLERLRRPSWLLRTTRGVCRLTRRRPHPFSGR